MAISNQTETLNDFGLQRRTRTTSRGAKPRYSVVIKSKPSIHLYNPKAMGEGPAIAIAEHYKKRIQGITAQAADSTQLARKYAADALTAGKSGAIKRYAGGLLGAMPPNQGNGALFNDSGRFAKSIVARPTRDDEWVINLAANRLDPSTFRDGEAGVMRMLEQLRKYIPEWGDSDAIVNVPEVKQEIALAADMILVNRLGAAYTRNKKLRAELRRGALDALLKGARLFTGVIP